MVFTLWRKRDFIISGVHCYDGESGNLGMALGRDCQIRSFSCYGISSSSRCSDSAVRLGLSLDRIFFLDGRRGKPARHNQWNHLASLLDIGLFPDLPLFDKENRQLAQYPPILICLRLHTFRCSIFSHRNC